PLLFITSLCFSQEPIFNAKGLICLSDGDSEPTHLLSPTNNVEKLSEDKAYVIAFPASIWASKKLKEYNISNSIFSSSSISEVSSNIPSLAFFLETKGSVSDGGSAPGTGGFISVMDVSSAANCQTLFRFPVANNPLSISLSPNNEYLAVSSEEYDNEIQVIEVSSEGKPVRKIKKPVSLGNDRISHICWSPDGEFLVYSNTSKREIGLIQVVRDAPTQKIIRLEVYGQPIKLGLNPGMGKFTPDGKFYIAADLKNRKSDQYNLLPAELFVVKFNFEPNQPHFLLSKQEVGYNLEDFVIHPNGSTIFALSSNKSFYATQSINAQDEGKLHLLDISTSGVISETVSYAIKGRYPSGLAIDKDGSHLAISVSEYETYGMSFGGVQFWNYIETPKKQLQKQNVDYYLPKGIHHLKAIK
ncbi:MAG: WD40 repeat domain-containing protein, partial [Spirosomaceae bacterium]|nr:WD40 repeat domain-containing protein [Spirosomataceae bacterium]